MTHVQHSFIGLYGIATRLLVRVYSGVRVRGIWAIVEVRMSWDFDCGLLGLVRA